MDTKKESQFLVCEHKIIYALLMTSAGMMGAYTFVLRGGVFCNAQTANIVMMAIKIGQGEWLQGVYFLIPIFAYFFGAFISEILPSPVKKLGLFRWDTYLVGFEILVLLGIGFMPLSWPHQVVQVLINFIASMQYNTFRQAEGIPMATTFCTNHVRQVGIAVAKSISHKDASFLKRGAVHLMMLLCFFTGGALLTLACDALQEKAIWLCLIPLVIAFIDLVHADLTTEHESLETTKPHGH